MELPNDVNNIQIIIKSPYNSNLANIPTFYIGNDISLIAYFFSKESFAVFICIAMFVYGIILIAYYFVFAHNIANNKLLKLGLFSILLSIWSLNECSVIKLLLRNNIVTSYISFLALMLLPFPFAQFVQSFYEDKSRIWDLFYKVDLIQIIASLLLCIIKLYDLSQTLWMTHAMLITVGVIVIVETILLNRDYVLSEQIKLHMFCTLICLGCMFLDLVGYYMGVGDNSRFNRVGFLLYILVLGVTSMKATKNLVKDADAYQTLAYTDQMTGLNNRTCFNKDFAMLSNTPNDIAVIDFDLNNLKKTNDTYGHSAGDKYITTCATIIHDIFKGIGKCYRVGGDEFVTLIERASTVDLTHYLAMLESSVDSANKGMKNWKMQIAYGYTIYDSDMDKNLEDTYNRADKIMYQNKEDKKTFRRT
jgi:diguanylate cyclase (GGDEF)-like protein